MEMTPYEEKLLEAIRPYFVLNNLIRDLRKGMPKAVEPAVRALELLRELLED